MEYLSVLPFFTVSLYLVTWLGYCSDLPKAKHPVRTSWIPLLFYFALVGAAHIIKDGRPHVVCIPSVYTFYGLPLTELCGIWIFLLIELIYGKDADRPFRSVRWWLLVITVAISPILEYEVYVAYVYQIFWSVLIALGCVAIIVWSDNA